MTMANRTTVPEPSASSESIDPVLTALYDNNSDPRNQADLRTLQQLSAEAFADPGIQVDTWRWGTGQHDWVHCFKPRQSASRLPALLFVHGGRWQLNTSLETSFWAHACAQQNWAMVSINFGPLSESFRLEDQIGAVRAALDAVRNGADHLALDHERLAVAGHSSGAHLALAACLAQPSTSDEHRARGNQTFNSPWRALLLVGGLYDLGPLTRTRFQGSLNFSDAELACCSPLASLAKTRSHHLPEVMVAVGEQETSEFRRQSRALFDVLSPQAQASWFEVPKTAHFDAPLEFNRPVSLMRAFISRHLGDLE
ncbi:MAG: alpha/beta hydrolase [Betaproteobacteria bacterium]|nr:alpha/beta hydrolase [Betaproteobacteria bacterium]